MRKSLQHADAVFIGKVIAIDDEASARLDKLPSEERSTAWHRALDVSYVVFARSRNGLLQSSACSLTRPLACATTLLADVGRASAGQDEDSRAEARPTSEQIYPLRYIHCIKRPLLLGEHSLGDLRHTAVNLVVDAEGNVREVAFADEDEAHPALAKRMRAWKFQPATLDGKPVAVRIQSISQIETKEKN